MIGYSARPRTRRWQRIAVFVVGILIAVGLLFSAVAYKSYRDYLKPVSAQQKSHLLTIPEGSSVRSIAEQLEEAGLIRSSWAFEWHVRLNGYRGKMQAGTYSLRANQSAQEIAIALTQGKIATDLVTILPAQRIDQIRTALINNGFEAADVDVALDPASYAGHPALSELPEGASLEGYLYPESYQKTTTTKPQDIIKASLDEMNNILTAELRAGLTKQGLSTHQGIILASIVEQEVSNSEDRRVVAQVFLKRFREGIPLGSDVTAFYGAIINGREPTISSVEFDTPYNTRIHGGLTPGPISNVGANSLQAVANPANTNFLFFVAGDDGKTYFSDTQAEHEQLTRQHCRKLCFE